MDSSDWKVRGDPMIGRLVADRFVPKRLIAQGSSARVYLAHETTLDRRVALKMLRPELCRHPDLAARFRAEAHIASRINHPNVVSIYDFGEDSEGWHYIAMEYIAGEPLDEILGRGPLPAPKAIEIGLQVLAAVEEAHARGVVHADLKSENVAIVKLRDRRLWARVYDFGISRVSPREGRAGATEVVFGTPAYLAPEVIRGREPTPSSDVYAAGVLLYELLTGEPPFGGDSLLDVLQRHLSEAPAPPSARRPDLEIPEALEAAILRSLSKTPGERFDSAGAFRSAVRRAVSRRRSHRRAAPEASAEIADFLAGDRDEAVLLLVPGRGPRRSTIAEAAGAAERRGIIVARAGADPSRPVPALSAIREAAAALLGLSPTASPAALASAARALALEEGDVAGIIELFGQPGPLREVDDHLRRLALGRSLLSLVETVGERAGGRVALIFEDLDACDPLSRHLCAELAAELEESGAARLLVTGELPGWEPTELFGGERQIGAGAIEGDLFGALAGRLLRALAIAGTRARRDDLAAMVRCEPDEVDDALADARDAGLVFGHGAWIALEQPASSQLVLASLDREARRLLHASFARILADHDRDPAERAFHLESAGDLAGAARAFARAGASSLRYFDPSGACASYRRAVSLARELARSGPTEERIHLLCNLGIRLADAFAADDRPGQAAQTLAAVRDWIELLDEPRLLASAALVESELALARSHPDPPTDLLEGAASAAIRSGSSELLLETSLALAESLAEEGAPRAALAALDRAEEEIARAADPPRGAWKLPLFRAELHHSAGDRARAIESAGQALERSRAESSRFGECRSHAVLATAYGELAPDPAAVHDREARLGMRRLGNFADPPADLEEN